MYFKTRVFGSAATLVRRLSYLLTRKNTSALRDYMKRELYGMGIREQDAVQEVLSMAGQVITVRRDTVAINKKLKPWLLQEGDRIRISKNPIIFDKQQNIYVALLDSDYNIFAIKLRDYLTDIHSAQDE